MGFRWPKGRVVEHPLYQLVNGGWFETTAIYADGNAPTGHFRRLERAVPGALLVYPDPEVNGRRRQGHVRIAVSVSGVGVAGVDVVIHCSVGNARRGDAIQVTAAAAWVVRQDAIVVWYEGLGEG